MIRKERDSKNGVNHLDKYQNMTNLVSAIVLIHSEMTWAGYSAQLPLAYFWTIWKQKKLISQAFFTLIVFIFFSVKVGIEKDKHNTHD